MDYKDITEKLFSILDGDTVPISSKISSINVFFSLCDYISDSKSHLDKNDKQDLYIAIDKSYKFIKTYADDSASKILKYLDNYDSIKLKEKLQNMSKEELIDYICSNKVNC